MLIMPAVSVAGQLTPRDREYNEATPMTNLRMTLFVLACVAAGCSDQRAGDRGISDMSIAPAGDLADLPPGSDLAPGGAGVDLAGAPAAWKPQPGTSWQ